MCVRVPGTNQHASFSLMAQRKRSMYPVPFFLAKNISQPFQSTIATDQLHRVFLTLFFDIIPFIEARAASTGLYFKFFHRGQVFGGGMYRAPPPLAREPAGNVGCVAYPYSLPYRRSRIEGSLFSFYSLKQSNPLLVG